MYFLVIIYQQKLSGMFDQNFNLQIRILNGYDGEVFADLKIYTYNKG